MSHNTDKNLIKEIRYEVVRRTEITNAGAGGEEIDTVLMDTVEEVVFEKTRHMHLSVSEKRNW
ncbi:hypothetical protein [Thermoclostridium stercorarium]|nr:hypothetical protein [Thermoclostridium stercorarium]